MFDRLRLRPRVLLLWLAMLSLMAYALVAEYGPAPAGNHETPELDAEPEPEPNKLRIVAVQPSTLPPGAAAFVQVAGSERLRSAELNAEVAKQRAEILHRGDDTLVVRVPPRLPYGQAKLRVLQGERRSKPWVLALEPLPRHAMLRDACGGLALFVLGLRTVGRSLRAYAGRRARSALERLTGHPLRAAGLGALLGALTQSTTSAAALVAGLLGARMLQLRAALVLLLGSQLGAAGAAVLLPSLVTREALWVVLVGALWVLLAESRLSRALGSVVVGAGLIFHGLGLLQAGLAPLISDPQVAPYLWYLEAGGMRAALACTAAGALLGAVFQGPAPVFALALSLSQHDLLGLSDGLALLAGTCLGGLFNTFAAAWAFGPEARRMARAQLYLTPALLLVSVCGLPLWQWVACTLAALSGKASAAESSQLQLGLGFVVMQCCAVSLGFALTPVALRLLAGRSLRESLNPNQETRRQELLRGLTLCRQGLRGVGEIIKSSDRTSAGDTEHALNEAHALLRALLRRSGDNTASATVATLHLTDALLSTLRVAEKAPELGLSPSGDVASALERLHALLDSALAAVCEQLEQGHAPSLLEAQAREIEINAAEADIRKRLFAVRSSGEELALRLWSSELCSAYETVGNQVYRAASAVAAEDEG